MLGSFSAQLTILDANLYNILVEQTVSTAMLANQDKFLKDMKGVIQIRWNEGNYDKLAKGYEWARARAAKKVKNERAKERSSRRFGPWNREGQSIPTVTGAGDRGRGSRKRELFTSVGNPVTGCESPRPRLLR